MEGRELPSGRLGTALLPLEWLHGGLGVEPWGRAQSVWSGIVALWTTARRAVRLCGGDGGRSGVTRERGGTIG